MAAERVKAPLSQGCVLTHDQLGVLLRYCLHNRQWQIRMTQERVSIFTPVEIFPDKFKDSHSSMRMQDEEEGIPESVQSPF